MKRPRHVRDIARRLELEGLRLVAVTSRGSGHLTATPAAPWHVTDECGELIASVVAVDHEGYHLLHPDGSSTVAPTLDHSDGGPWDGQSYTITRELKPAAAAPSTGW